METKEWMKQRIDAYLKENKGKHPEEEKQWEAIRNQYNRTRLTAIIELGIDKLNIKYFRKTPNWRIVTNENKIEFTESWNPHQKNTLLNINKDGWQLVGAGKGTPQSQPNATQTAIAKLHAFCREHLDNRAPVYKTEELCDTSGEPVFKVTVTHPTSDRIKGEAMDLTTHEATRKAAENALATLKQSIQKEDHVEIPSSQDTNPTENNAGSTDTSTQEDGNKTEESMNLTQKNFKSLLFKTLISAKDEFKQAITDMIDEIVNAKINSTVQRVVNDTVLDKINETVKSVATSTITDAVKADLVKQVEPEVTKQVKEKCKKGY